MIAFDCKLTRPSFVFDVAFNAGSGVTALFGPSGSGKSTAIRLIAGLEQPERGRIAIGDTLLLDTARQVAVPRHRRRIGLVFQDALLLPHLDVKANLLYGRWFTAAAERKIDFDSVVGVLGIGHLLSRQPATLSGGERQRIAIGRALLTSPRLLLMDEPLASLDAARKLEILPFIERLRDEFSIPIVYVSHSTEEVVRLASHVVRLDQGRVVAAGLPQRTIAPVDGAAPVDRFDMVSILSGSFRRYIPEYQVTVLEHPAGEIVVPGRIEARHRAVDVLVRATSVSLAVGPVGDLSVRTVLAGRIERLHSDGGPSVIATIALTGGALLSASITRMAVDQLKLAPGSHVHALIKAVSIDERGLAGHRSRPAPTDAVTR